MEKTEGQDEKRSFQAAAPRLPRSYNFLINLSRRMGTVATKSSIVHDVRSFMNQEISLSPSETILGNTLPKITVTHPTDTQLQKSVVTSAKQQQQKDLQKIVSKSHQLLMSANTV